MSFANISQLRKNLYSRIKNVIDHNDSIIIKTKKGNAIIITEEEYNTLRETIYLISQKGLANNIKEGEKEDISSMKTYISNEKW